MIKGVHAMFYSSKADQLRDFIKDKLKLPYCDDLEKTVAELRSRGVTFDDGIADHGYGFVTHLTMPGGVKVQKYQPKYSKR